VIIATGQADVETAVIGLRLGADDLMVKPFQPALFAARVGAVLRRAGAVRDKETLEFGELRIDLTAREVSLERLPVDMPAREFDLLAFLATHPRQVFTRSQLLEQVWESSSEWQDEATVTEHIRKIRLRIEADPRNPRWISTVRRVGYRFNA
jgi:two-component system phosphate regulon response regulator PhoB